MANIMNLKSIRNNTSRNGFDLSFKKNFSAKVGELLPVMCKEVLPGDVFDIDLKSLVRTKPLNTAAFGRIREYYDFFFVPYNLLWNKADTVLTQMLDNPQHSNGWLSSLNTNLDGKMPYISMSNILSYLWQLNLTTATGDNGKPINQNYFGYSRPALSCKLLEYLGYGNYENALTETILASTPMKNLNLNLFGLLAYQKIYADFFRDAQWERINPSTFNVDFIKGTSDLAFPTSTLSDNSFRGSYNLFDLRYCNWQKDLFHGVVPNAQYGESSVYPLSIPATINKYNVVTSVNFDSQNTSTTQVVSDISNLDANLDILKLRQYEFLQKWKEIAQTANKDYKDQVQKHWGVNVGDYASELCQYLGGTASSIDISEVVNNNITNDAPADIAGKGYGVNSGNIHFESQGKYGVIMCIYHAVPMVDYITDTINPAFTKVNSTDYAIPEFDRIGMQAVPLVWMNNSILPSAQSLNAPDLMLGYAPRYIDYKTSVDETVGSLKRSDSHWILGFGYEDLYNQLSNYDDTNNPDTNLNNFIYYTFFKVNPNIADSIFAVSADSNLDTDQLLCSSYFDMKVVRNLDTDGLPY